MKSKITYSFLLFVCFLFGYQQPVFSQTYTVSSCTYNYYAPGGSFLTMGDDVIQGPFAMPFNFTFFGTSYNQLWISSNGFVTFNNNPNSGCCSGQLLPDAFDPNNLIAATWEDIYPPGGGTVSYQTIGTSPNRIFVVCWNNVPHFISGNPVSVQAQLFETTNEIRCVLQSMPTDGGLHTLGIENATGTVAYTAPGKNASSWSATNECWSFNPCPQPPAPFANGTTICSGQTATLTATGVLGASFEWYNASVGGTLLGSAASYTTPALTSNTTYYVQQTLANCPSVRTAVVVTVNPNTTGTVSPNPVTVSSCSGNATQNLTFTNTGGCGMNWSLQTCDPPLATVLSNVNASAATIISQIPTPWTFQAICNACPGGLPDGACGNNICDAGNDMYDGANILGTNLATGINYSDNLITASPSFGAGGSYFTRLVASNNLWVMAADVNALTLFEITGNNGADGSGLADGAVLTGTACGNTYKGFVKRVYNAVDPSINHLIIVRDNGSVSHTFSTNTNDDLHSVTNLGGVTRIYYVLFGSTAGAYVNNTQMQAIFDTFLNNIVLGSGATLPAYLTVSPTSGTVSGGGTGSTTLTFNPTSLAPGTYNSSVVISYNGGSFTVPTSFTVGSGAIPAPTSANTSICPNASATLNVTGQAGATFSWYNAPTGGTLLGTGASYNTGPLAATTSFYVSQTVGGCVSPRTTVTVNVSDIVPPTLNCPSNQTANTAPGTCAATVNGITSTQLDNCGIQRVTWVKTGATTASSPATGINTASGTSFNTGVTTVTYTATDNSNNTATCSFTVTVTDNILPSLTCPANTTANVGPGTCTATVNGIAATYSDNCGIQKVTWVKTGATTASSPTIGINNASGTSFNTGVTTVTYTATDNSNNTASCSFTVTVTDNLPPSLTCPSNLAVNVAPASCSAVVNGIAPIFFDNCVVSSVTWVKSGATTASSPATGVNNASGTSFNAGVTTVTYTVTDNSNNTASCSFTVTVNDNILPTISCPANVVPTVSSPCPGAVVNGIAATYADNCVVSKVTWVKSGATVANSPATGINDASGTPFNAGVTTVTYTVTDGANNTASCSFTVTIGDVTPPTIACPGNITTLSGLGQCQANINNINAVSSDNCGIQSVTWTKTGATTASSPATGLNNASGSVFNVGTTTLTYTATDNAGNTATCSFTVTINDLQNPSITCPGNVTTSTSLGQCSATISNLAATYSDNCGVQHVTWVKTGATTGASPATGINNVSGTSFNTGVTTVTYTATDVNNRTASCSFTITVSDFEAPVITCPSNPSVTTTGCNSVVTFTPIVTDNCPGVTYSASPASGSAFNIGTTTVTVTATDAAGNTATCSFNVTVSLAGYSILGTPNQTLIADAECTDNQGWTHYYHSPTNTIVLSVFKNGNSIGNIGGGLTVQTATLSNYSSNTATHVTNPPADYVDNPLWHVMNRYWVVNPVSQPTTPVKVRFYFLNQDLNDINGSVSPATTITDLKFYKINGAFSPNPDPDGNPLTSDGHSGVPEAPARNATGYVEYDNGASSTAQNWLLGNFSTGYYAEYEVDLFSGGGGGSGSGTQGALPVELLSFTGQRAGDVNHLFWTTTVAQSIEHFEVERENPFTNSFEKLGEVSAINAALPQKNYNFEDNQPYSGTNKYRLKIVDIDGGVGYSAVLVLNNTLEAQCHVYPSPAKDVLQVSLTNIQNDAVTFTLYNAAGQVVIKEVWNVNGTTIRTLDVSEFSKGVYLYKVSGGELNYSGKVLITD